MTGRKRSYGGKYLLGTTKQRAASHDREPHLVDSYPIASVMSFDGHLMTVRLAGDGQDLFGAQRELQRLGAIAGDTILVQNDFETLAAKVETVNASGELTLSMAGLLGPDPKIVTLIPTASGRAWRTGRNA